MNVRDDTVWRRRLGDLEAVVMERIWSHDDKVRVRDIYDELLSTRPIAYTTVMSTMDNLHTKEWLARERAGKAYLYWPTLTREERSAHLMRAALSSGGDSELVLTHFLEQISDQESVKLAEALRRIRKRRTR